jgi:hypothetical protein
MTISAMKQALEVIEAAIESGDWQIDGACDPSMAIHSLYEAIAEAEKQEPVAWFGDADGFPVYAAPVHASDISQECVDKTAKHGHEPVAWREVTGKTTHYYDYNEDGRGEPLYVAPQPDLARVGEVGVWGEKREWVGLTDEEVHDAFNFVEFVKQVSFDRDRPEWCENFAAYLEAKLKEKNT